MEAVTTQGIGRSGSDQLRGRRRGTTVWLATGLMSHICVSTGSSPERNTTARDSTPPPEAGFLSHVKPFFAKNCILCHNARLNTGRPNLQAITSAAPVSQDREKWAVILAKLQAGEMPPNGLPRPDPTDVTAVTTRIQTEFDRLATRSRGAMTTSTVFASTVSQSGHIPGPAMARGTSLRSQVCRRSFDAASFCSNRAWAWRGKAFGAFPFSSAAPFARTGPRVSARAMQKTVTGPYQKELLSLSNPARATPVGRPLLRPCRSGRSSRKTFLDAVDARARYMSPLAGVLAFNHRDCPGAMTARP